MALSRIVGISALAAFGEKADETLILGGWRARMSWVRRRNRQMMPRDFQPILEMSHYQLKKLIICDPDITLRSFQHDIDEIHSRG